MSQLFIEEKISIERLNNGFRNECTEIPMVELEQRVANEPIQTVYPATPFQAYFYGYRDVGNTWTVMVDNALRPVHEDASKLLGQHGANNRSRLTNARSVVDYAVKFEVAIMTGLNLDDIWKEDAQIPQEVIVRLYNFYDYYLLQLTNNHALKPTVQEICWSLQRLMHGYPKIKIAEDCNLVIPRSLSNKKVAENQPNDKYGRYF